MIMIVLKLSYLPEDSRAKGPGLGYRVHDMMWTLAKCHNLDFRVLDTTSGSWGNWRQVMPICAGTSQMDLASATWGW